MNQISTEMIYVLALQLAFILLSFLCLARPRFIFGFKSPALHRAFIVMGIVLLSMSFCYSFVLGCILRLTDIAQMG